MRAVTFESFGGIDVLKVADKPVPTPDSGQLLVRVKAAATNPMDTKIREGWLQSMFPVEFPARQGSDLAGVVEAVGPDVTGFAVGDEVLGAAVGRAGQAELALASAALTVKRPAAVSWEIAGALFVAGTTAWAMVDAVEVKAGELVLVAGATGGVGAIAAQLAKLRGARVVGVAGDVNAHWLEANDIMHVNYGDGLASRVSAVVGGARIDAALDCFGPPNVGTAIALGVTPGRIDTIADFEAPGEWSGVKTAGSAEAASADVLARLAELVASGKLQVPVAASFPLAQVQEAYRVLEQKHPLGKVVLVD